MASKFKTIDDITRERASREREESNENIAQDIDDVINRVQTKISFRKQKKKKRRFLRTFLWILFFIFIFVIIANFVLLNIWALKFFVKSLFGI